MTVSSGDGEALITLMVFDTDLGNLLAGLKKGDSLSVIGSGSVRAYADKEGKPAAGITVMVNRLMSMTAKEAAPRSKGNGQRRQSAGPQAPPLSAYSDPEPFRDQLPF